MASTNLDRMATHLEFLGYRIEREGDIVKAFHSSKVNVLLRDFKGGVMLTSFLRCQDTAKSDRGGYLDFINTLNKTASANRFYADKDSDLCIEAFYAGAYEREAFGGFMELWDEDISRIAGLVPTEARKYLR